MRVKIKTKKMTIIALSVALAMIFSYVESLIPPLSMVPGVKIGLANTVSVFLLYSLGPAEAALVSLIRVCLSSMLFGTPISFVYSVAGAVVSLIAMVIAKRFLPFSKVGVSVIGALMHNAGQVAAACVVMGTAAIAVYFIPLIITGTVSGVLIGVIAGIVISRIAKFLNPKKTGGKTFVKEEKKKADTVSKKK